MDVFKYTLLLITWLVTVTLTGCTKLVEVDPPATSLVSDAVFTANETAISAITGVYSQMSNAYEAIEPSLLNLSLVAGLSADELTLSSDNAGLLAYYTNRLTSSPALSIDYWRNIYSPYIYISNVAIKQLEKATTYEQNSQVSLLNEGTRKQLLGEMQFFRAFCYFYLVQLYGDVPLLLTPDYIENSTNGRTSKALVYEQMIKDLLAAQANLNSAYVEADVITTKNTSARIRPIKGAATALLARIYLYNGNYAAAEQQALTLIQNTNQYRLVGVDSIMRVNNPEAIWQLQSVVDGRNSHEGWFFVLPETGPTTGANTSNPVYLNRRFLDVFETGDIRKMSWINSVTVDGVQYYYPYKYKSAQLYAEITEYTTVFRLAEQYLICAEARARMNNLSGADSMLNVIRRRAGLAGVSFGSQEEVIKSIMHERQVELFTEWGHRWFDLKRTGMVDAVMEKETPLKGGSSWMSYQQLCPIPISDIQLIPALRGQQNPGYE